MTTPTREPREASPSDRPWIHSSTSSTASSNKSRVSAPSLRSAVLSVFSKRSSVSTDKTSVPSGNASRRTSAYLSPPGSVRASVWTQTDATDVLPAEREGEVGGAVAEVDDSTRISSALQEPARTAPSCPSAKGAAVATVRAAQPRRKRPKPVSTPKQPVPIRRKHKKSFRRGVSSFICTSTNPDDWSDYSEDEQPHHRPPQHKPRTKSRSKNGDTQGSEDGTKWDHGHQSSTAVSGLSATTPRRRAKKKLSTRQTGEMVSGAPARVNRLRSDSLRPVEMGEWDITNPTALRTASSRRVNPKLRSPLTTASIKAYLPSDAQRKPTRHRRPHAYPSSCPPVPFHTTPSSQLPRNSLPPPFSPTRRASLVQQGIPEELTRDEQRALRRQHRQAEAAAKAQILKRYQAAQAAHLRQLIKKAGARVPRVQRVRKVLTFGMYKTGAEKALREIRRGVLLDQDKHRGIVLPKYQLLLVAENLCRQWE
ncbi:hypothetical protein BDV95DRAFT_603695 [Massariosphaeria phaeospora]|uniref:Uncharacterized protein n=1 Tax=Massariosphaeria phaeospora TaxID=100035 RepID=A0A7C8IE88_9PLEO|nr:hypothetical protein BDV95DRAFT_603695 [Massariosphaeria phaeospora]